MDSLQSPSSPEGLKPFACTICVQRKVKCDKRHPCSACLKTRLQCVYRTEHTVGRKRRRDSSNQDHLKNAEYYEPPFRDTIVSSAGLVHSVDANNDHRGDETLGNGARQPALPSGLVRSRGLVSATQLPHRSILVPETGGHRYYEHGFIGILGQQYRQDPIGNANGRANDALTEAQQAACEELASTMFTGVPSPAANALHPQIPPAMEMKYWQTFLTNVHPITKIVHPPTEHQIMTESISDHSVGTDALRYSICACAVASSTEQECQAMFGGSQGPLLSGFQSATRHNLLKASFLRVPNSSLLRAQVLLLTSMLQTSDSSSLWILMGSVMRMAQSQGLHRDGLGLGLSPFQTEMRRRLWWYVVTLDGRLTELTGSESTLPKFRDTLLPLNVNDGDLDPAMKTSPQERVGSSEMTFCLVHYEAGRFLAEYDPRYDESERRLSLRLGRPADYQSASELESFLEERFFRFCDPIIPVQFLTTLLGRSNLCKFRQMEHRRLYQPDPDGTPRTNSGTNNTTLNVAVRNIEYDNLIHSSRSLRGFLWHVNFYFPWGAPIFILKDLAFHPEWDEDMQAAWARIEELYEHHPEYKGISKIQYLIIGGLTVQAWAAWEATMQSQGISKQQTPTFIQELQNQQASYLTKRHELRPVGTSTPTEALNYAALNDYDFTNFDLMDATFADVDWSSWNGY